MKQNDILIRGLLFDGAVALTAISGKTLVNTAREAHGLSRVCTAALGRTLLQTAIMGCKLKNDGDALTCIISGSGPVGNIVCSAETDYRVRGYIENPTLELPPKPDGKLDVSGAVGNQGELTVIRSLSLKDRYVGKCALVSGEIADDFANYFFQSEQTPSLIYLGVRIAAQTGELYSAGGIMLTPLPGCPDEVIDKLQESAERITELSGLLVSDTLEHCLEILFADMQYSVLETATPRFECNCSRERLSSVLIALGKDELTDMADTDHGAELTCRFCNKQYQFSEQDLRALIIEAQGGLKNDGQHQQ